MPGNVYRILIVEDQQDIRLLLQAMLTLDKVSRFEFEEAITLQGAISRIGIEQFQVVLLDLNLPDSGGLSTLDVLVAKFPDLPVVVLTSESREEIQISALQHGAQDFLIKPDDLNTTTVCRSLRYAHYRGRYQREQRERAKLIPKSIQMLERLESAVQTDAAEDIRHVLSNLRKLAESK